MGSPAAAVAFLQYLTSQQGEDGASKLFDTAALQGLKDFKAESGRLQCRMDVERDRQNRMGNLHGGCTATLVDVIGTGALLTIASRGGVSLNINVTYVDSMPGTQTSGKSRGVIVDAHVLRVGRTVSTIAVDFYDEEDGRLVASGTHVKYVSDKEPDLSKHLGQALSGENIDRPLSTEQLKAGSRGRSKSVRHASAADEHGTRSRL